MTRRRMPAAIALLAGAAAAISLAPAAVAAPARQHAAVGYRLNPARNIRPPQTVYGPACQAHPLRARCTGILLAALNHAHAVMGQPKYAVPSRFASLRPQEQLLVLANLDRRLYGRTPITGLNGRLDASARTGAQRDQDPPFVRQVNGAGLWAGAANWAGASTGSPLFAYYMWMFDDGPGSYNIDCKQAGDAGCWGHRDGTLLRAPAGTQVELGVGQARSNGGYWWTELFEEFARSATIPCVPTVTGLSRYSGPTSGGRLTVQGYGFVRVRTVTVLGQAARILDRTRTAVTVAVPRHAAGSGHVLVTTSGGTSNPTRAAAYRYGA